MAYTALVGLGSQIGVGITSVKLYQCGTNCTSCTPITNYTSVAVSSFNSPGLLVTGITDGSTCIKAEPVGVCSGSTQCIIVSGIPGPTPSPTVPPATPGPTAGTTPLPTAGTTPLPTPTATVPRPTATVTAPAATPTPTATALPGCGSTVTGTYDLSGFTTQTVNLNFSGAVNGGLITVHYTANSRPDRFTIKKNGLSIVANSGWVGSDYNYSGPWDLNGIADVDGDGYMTFTYDNSATYQLLVDVGNANPSNILNDSWSVTFSCAPGSTPTPTATVDGSGGGGVGGGGTMYDCLGGVCTQTVSGTYSSLIDCQNSGCGSGGGSGGCFIEGTMVTLSDGTQKLIEELVIGDILKSYSIDTLPLYSDDETVLNTWSSNDITGDYDVATVISIISDTSHGVWIINNLLKTTGRHRHLIKRDGAWSFIEAYQVVVGDILLDINNNEIEVTSKTTDSSDYTIYKLDVENLDVFYANDILTHNVKNYN